MIDSNATQAAIRAGYSRSTARSIASENLTKPFVQDRIAELRREVVQRNELKVDHVVEELRRIAFGGLSCFIRVDANGAPHIDLSDCTRENLDLLQDLVVESGASGGGGTVTRVRLKPLSKLRALEMLGRMLGMFDRQASPGVDDGFRLFIENLQRRGSRPPLKTG